MILNLRSMQIEMSEQEWGSLKSEYLVFMCPSGLRVCRYKTGKLKHKRWSQNEKIKACVPSALCKRPKSQLCDPIPFGVDRHHTSLGLHQYNIACGIANGIVVSCQVSRGGVRWERARYQGSQ